MRIGAGVCLLTMACAAAVRADVSARHAAPKAPASALSLASATLIDTLVVASKAAAGAVGPAVGGLVTRIELDEERGARDLADVLAATAGFQIRRYGGAGASAVPSLRGAAAAQIRLFIDGMPLDDAQSGVFDLERLPLDRFESVAIHRGTVPAGLGGIGGAGAVDLRTRRSRDGLTVGGGGGSFGEVFGRAAWGASGADGEGMLLVHGRRADNGFEYLDHNNTFSRSDDDTVRTRRNAGFREHGLFGKGSVAAGAFVLRGWAGYVRRDGGRPGPMSRPSPHASVRYDRLDGHLGAGWRQDLVRLGFSAARTDQELWDPAGEILFGVPQHQRSSGDDITGRLVYSPDLDLGRGADLALQAGVERRGQWLQLWLNDRPEPRRNRAETTLFAVADLGLARGRLRVAPAWRWQRVRDDFPPVPPLPWLPAEQDVVNSVDLVSPTLGVTWEISPGRLFLESHAGRTLRPPTWVELFGVRGGIDGNRELQPERIRSLDLGLTGRAAGGAISGRLAVFAADTDSTIVFVQNSQATSQAMNIGRTRTRGLEAELTAGLPAQLDLLGNVTWQHARDAGGQPAYDGKQLPYLPDVEAFLRLARSGDSWRPWCELDFRSANYLDRANSRTNMAGTRLRLNLGLDLLLRPGWLGARGDLLLSGAVLNLTDMDIYDIEGFPLPGRSWRAGLRLRL